MVKIGTKKYFKIGDLYNRRKSLYLKYRYNNIFSEINARFKEDQIFHFRKYKNMDSFSCESLTHKTILKQRFLNRWVVALNIYKDKNSLYKIYNSKETHPLSYYINR